MSEGQSAVYLYCFARSGRVPKLAEAAIDSRQPLMQACNGGVVAVWSEVAREMFCGEKAEMLLEDPVWLGTAACRHEAVVEEVMRHSPVFPVRFATLFSSHQSLDDFVAAHYVEISGLLSRLGSQREWAVKGYLDRQMALERLGIFQKLEGEQAVASGKRYLMKKTLQSEAEQELRQWVKGISAEAVNRLQNCANQFRERKAVRFHKSNGLDLVLNWAFLIAPEAEPAFRAVLEEIQCENSGRGLNLAMSGPLPPYSFTPALGLAEHS